MSIVVQHQHFCLHPFKGMYWEEKDALIVSDTHFGKISHFRKHGFPIPTAAINDNWKRLGQLIDYFKPQEIIYLGDLFHSDYNLEWDDFSIFKDTFPDLQQTLVMGNHDILHQEFYTLHDIQCFEAISANNILLTHEPSPNEDTYNIYGHIHPGVKLQGRGKQSIKLPSFVFKAHCAILPAFGAFTGLATQPTKPDDQIFVIADQQIISVN